MKLKYDFPLRRWNSFGINASAAVFCDAASLEDLRSLLLRDWQLPRAPLLLGGGSNLLFTDDYEGPVLHVGLRGIEERADGGDELLLRAAAGENWHGLVRYCVERGWGGIENLALIPGSVGAAPVQNIGAYGVELSNTLVEVELMDRDTGNIHSLSAADCLLAYRDSIFKGELKNRVVITAVTLRLSRRPKLEYSYGALTAELQRLPSADRNLRAVFEAVCRIRRSKLPDPAVIGNAGSFFKNPIIARERYERIAERFDAVPHYPLPDGQVKIPAGWLIEQCGWKGKQLGNAACYERQALVLVNPGAASGQDILNLARAIQDSVRTTFDLELTPEVTIL